MLNPDQHLIPPDAWKKNRDRMVRAAKSKLHLTETNPGPESNRLRYDYILTKADVAMLVETVMRDTERLAAFYLEKKNSTSR